MKKPEEFKKVAVLGCGLIGFSWATVFCRNGLKVNVYNVHPQSLNTVKDRVSKALSFLCEEGMVDANTAVEAVDNITTFNTLEEAVKDVDYIQECFPENLEIKQEVFFNVTNLTTPDVIIGSSCSGLKISDITARVVNHSERCIVAHPANPPHVVPFMEIAGDASSEEVKESAYHFMEYIGQKPIKCKEVYGYVLNRVQLALIQEALFLVENEICSVEAVDRALTDGLGLRWAFTGPYGVEELNSISLEVGLEKYKGYMLEGFEELGKVKDYDKEFIKKAVDGFKPVMKGMNHDEYLKWRDKMVVRTRMLKERNKR